MKDKEVVEISPFFFRYIYRRVKLYIYEKINVEVKNSLLSDNEIDSYDRYDRLTGSCSDQEYFGTLVEVKDFIGVGACLSSTWWQEMVLYLIKV